jgi:hypothetical protein
VPWLGPTRQGLGSAHARHPRTHQGAVHGVVTQHGHPGKVALLRQPAIQKAPGPIGPVTRLQVHDQKRNVGHHIDPAQCGIELDGIEGLWLPFQQHQIAQVQVAVAFAHPPRQAPGLEHGRQGRALLLAPGGQRLQCWHQRRPTAIGLGLQGRQTVAHRSLYRPGRAPALRGTGHCGRGMEAGDFACQGIHVCPAQLPVLQTLQQQVVLRKAAHANGWLGVWGACSNGCSRRPCAAVPDSPTSPR